MGIWPDLRERRVQRTQREIERLEHELGLPRGGEERASVQDWMDAIQHASQFGALRTSMPSLSEEQVAGSLNGIIKSSSPVFALTMARMQVFSQVRFQWTRFTKGEPSDLFGSPDLRVLERPWRGGTTADLLARMEMDVTGAGNAYIRRIRRPRQESRLVRLRPDWVITIMGSQEDVEHPSEAADVELLGYAYVPHGGKSDRMVILEPHELAHYAPYPDPDNVFIGMSWVTPALRDVLGDNLQTDHKRAFLRNGAPQPLDAGVLTPDGWTTMGALSVGDQVVGSDGQAHRVRGVYPKGDRTVYRVQFRDGGSTECTADHLWTVSNLYDRKRGVTRTRRLDELLDDGLAYPSGAFKWAVPLVDPVEFADHPDVPVDPYLMGLLLGDGSFRGNRRGDGQHGNVTLAMAAEDADEIVTSVEAALPADITLSRRDRGAWSELYFRGPSGPFAGSLKAAIRDLSLWGCGSREKFIPAAYLTASVKDRAALLQGLIDSDGSVDARQPNLVTYTTNSDALATGVVELVRGLGGLATKAQHGGRDRWTVNVMRLPDWIIPARLSRKAGRYETSAMSRWRTIVSVTEVGTKPTQCISVESADSLYVTDDFILTHNTPNMVIKFDPAMTIETVEKFKTLFEAEHKGAANAYKTLFLGGGADATAVGANFKELDFAVTQGKAESRMASDAGVPPSWVGFSEGLQGSGLNAGNYTASRRRFSDGTMHHLWSNAATSLETIVDPPDDGASLWFATRGVPFLRMDATEEANTQAQEASTIAQLIREGFTWESVKLAVANHDWDLLVHSGLLSVQLQPPGSGPDGAAAPTGGNS